MNAYQLYICKGNKWNGSIACEGDIWYVNGIFELVMEQLYAQEFPNYIQSYSRYKETVWKWNVYVKEFLGMNQNQQSVNHALQQ